MIIALSILLGALGVYLYLSKLSLNYHIHTSFLVIPVFCVAYLIRTYIHDIERYLKWYAALIACGVIYLYVGVLKTFIELAAESIGSGYSFFLLAFMGIYVCLYLSKLINKVNILAKVFALFGKYSFEIMALHFVIVKLVDVVYAKMFLVADPAAVAKFPSAFTYQIWYVYAILGTAIPALIGWFVEKTPDLARKLVKTKNKEPFVQQ